MPGKSKKGGGLTTKKYGFKFEADPSLTGAQDSGTVVIEKNKPKKKETDTTSDTATEMSAFNLKPIPEGDKGKGLRALDKDVRNNMGYQMKYQMVNKEGFKMAGSPTKQAAFLNNGTTSKETNKNRTETDGGTETNYTGGGKFKNKEEKAWYDNQIKKRTDKGMSQEEAIQDYRNTFKIGEKKENKLPNKVQIDPIMDKKRVFNIQEQRERGNQSLLAGRQSKREGLENLLSQKKGLKTAFSTNLDKVKNAEYGSNKERRNAIKTARQQKRQGMRSFRKGNFQGAADVLQNNQIFNTQGFDAGASDLARRQFSGIDKSVRYYDTQSALDKRVGFGGTYLDNQRQTQAGADFQAEINPLSATNTLMNKKFNSGFNQFSGFNMKKGFKMKGSSYKNKK